MLVISREDVPLVFPAAGMQGWWGKAGDRQVGCFPSANTTETSLS